MITRYLAHLGQFRVSDPQQYLLPSLHFAMHGLFLLRAVSAVTIMGIRLRRRYTISLIRQRDLMSRGKGAIRSTIDTIDRANELWYCFFTV
jgi:hypothetical protein